MHHTLTHVTQLDVCPPRRHRGPPRRHRGPPRRHRGPCRRRGPRRRRVLPPSSPSQPIHIETWQIA